MDRRKRVLEQAELATSLPKDSLPFPQVFQALSKELTKKNSESWADLQYWKLWTNLLDRMPSSIALHSNILQPLREAFVASLNGGDTGERSAKVAKLVSGEQKLADVSELRLVVTKCFGYLLLRFTSSFRPSTDVYMGTFFLPVVEAVLGLSPNSFREMFDFPVVSRTLVNLDDPSFLEPTKSGALFVLLGVAALKTFQNEQSNAKRVFEVTCNKLLPKLLVLQSRLENLDTEFASWVQLSISDAIAAALFHKKHLSGFDGALFVEAQQGQYRSFKSYQRCLFEQLETLLKGGQADLILQTIPGLFRGYLAACKDFSLDEQEQEDEDVVSVKQVKKQESKTEQQTAARFAIYKKFSELATKGPRIQTNVKVQTLLLRGIAEFEIYHSNQDAKGEYAALLQAHLTRLLDDFGKTLRQASDNVVGGYIAQGVSAFIAINPHLLEGWLDRIFLLSSWGFTLPPLSPARVELDSMLATVTDSFFKLRQFETLIVSFYEAAQVRSPSMRPLQCFCPALGQQISFLPALQISKLWSLFVDTMLKIPPQHSSQMHIYSSTFAFFLQNIEVSEPIADSLLALYLETVNGPLVAPALNGANNSFFDLGSALELFYGLNVVKDKCEAWRPNTNKFALTPFANASCSFSVEQLRQRLQKEADKSVYRLAEYTLRKVALQRIGHCHLQFIRANFVQAEAKTLLSECTELTTFVLSVLSSIHQEHEKNPESGGWNVEWNDAIPFETDAQYLVACWDVITSSLSVLLCYATSKQVYLVQQVLLQAIMVLDIETSALKPLYDESSTSTNTHPILQLYQDAAFYEVEQLRAQFVLVVTDIVRGFVSQHFSTLKSNLEPLLVPNATLSSLSPWILTVLKNGLPPAKNSSSAALFDCKPLRRMFCLIAGLNLEYILPSHAELLLCVVLIVESLISERLRSDNNAECVSLALACRTISCNLLRVHTHILAKPFCDQALLQWLIWSHAGNDIFSPAQSNLMQRLNRSIIVTLAQNTEESQLQIVFETLARMTPATQDLLALQSSRYHAVASILEAITAFLGAFPDPVRAIPFMQSINSSLSTALLPFLQSLPLDDKSAAISGSILGLFGQVLLLCATVVETDESDKALLGHIGGCLERTAKALNSAWIEAHNGATRFLSTMCSCSRFFRPRLEKETFSYLLSLVFHLCTQPSDRSLPSPIHDCFLSLLEQCKASQFRDIVPFLLEEMHQGVVSHVMTALQFFEETNKKKGRGSQVVTDTTPHFLASVAFIASKHNDQLTNLANVVLGSCLSRKSFELSAWDFDTVMFALNSFCVRLSRYTFEGTLRTVYACVQHRPLQMHRKVALIFKCVRRLMLCCLEGIDKELNGGAAWPEQYTQNFGRLLQQLGDDEHKKQLQKLAPYLLCDYVNAIKKFALAGVHKRIISAAVFAIMALCSEYEFKVVHAALDAGGRTLFKDMHADFAKTRYTGKV